MNIFETLPELDQLAVLRDAERLDALARRDTGGPSEGVHALLWALGADVDEGLAALLAAPMVESEPAVVLSLADAGRRRAARTLTAALLATGLVSLSGVAAAVTGDPLSPYRSVISAVTDDDDRSVPRDDEVKRQMRIVRAALGDGDLADAQTAVEELRTGVNALPDGKRRAAGRQLAALEAKLERAEVKEARDTAKDAAKDEKDAAKDRGETDGATDDGEKDRGETDGATDDGEKDRGETDDGDGGRPNAAGARR